MADGLSAVATKALPRAMASGSWLGRRKATAAASGPYHIVTRNSATTPACWTRGLHVLGFTPIFGRFISGNVFVILVFLSNQRFRVARLSVPICDKAGRVVCTSIPVGGMGIFGHPASQKHAEQRGCQLAPEADIR